jgi:hypothetical protein
MNFATKAAAKVITPGVVPNVFLLVFTPLLHLAFQLAGSQLFSCAFYFLPMLTLYYHGLALTLFVL